MTASSARPTALTACGSPATLLYPEWRAAEPVEPRTLAAYRPNIVAPDEVPDYTPDWQAELITAWLACLLSGLRPLPLLVPIGMNGGGKTTLVKAVLRTLMGPDTDITGVPDSVRDLQTQITTAPMVGLDNVDKEVPPWFGDELAAGLTGKAIEMRQLYTNAVKLSRPVTAALAVTTRTGAFFRPDIAQRALPVLTDEFTDPDRVADEELLGEVDARRDGLLSGARSPRRASWPSGATPRRAASFAPWTLPAWSGPTAPQGRSTQAAHMPWPSARPRH